MPFSANRSSMRQEPCAVPLITDSSLHLQADSQAAYVIMTDKPTGVERTRP